MKLGQNIASLKSRTSLEMGQVGSKLRQAFCTLSRPSQILLNQIFMKLGQNVCLDRISDVLKLGHVGSKTRSRSNHRKTLCSL